MTAPPMPDVALLPCPGCGGKAHWPEPEVGMNWVGCTECGAWTAPNETAWNRRADAGLLAALEGFVTSIAGRNSLDRMLTINHPELMALLNQARAAIAAAKGHDHAE